MLSTAARIRRATLALKAESAYGTDPWVGAPAAGDLVPVDGPTPSEPRGFYRWRAHSGLLDSLPGTPGELMARIAASLRLRGKGSAYAAGVKPEADLILRPLGFSATVDATPGSEKWTYKAPKAPTHESLAAWFLQENADTLKLLGGFGDGALLFTAGAPVVLDFSLMGIHGGRPAQALVTSQPSASPIHPILASASFQIGSENYAAAFRSLRINLNNIVSAIPGPNEANAYAGFFITRDPDRPITLEFDPQAVTAATFAWFTKWGNGTLVDWSFQTTGAQYTRVKFSGTKAQISGLGWGEREGDRTHPVVLDLIGDSGEDSLVITFD